MSGAHDRLALRVLLPGFGGRMLDGAAGREVGALVDEGLGGVCLFGSNTADGPEAVAALTGRLRALGPVVVAVDEEGGDVTRLHATTGSPVLGPGQLGAVDDLDLTRTTAAAIAAELAAVGVGLDLGPVADVNSSVDNPVIGVRSFGAEPDHVARHVAAWVAGLQGAGVAACAKHFPGHGDTSVDSHVDLPVVDSPLDLVRRRELVPFAAAVEAGVAAVMTSHLVLRAVDPDRPATLSPPVLDLLRTELGFSGAIVSDALDMAGASAGRGIPAAAVAAVAAGCDLLCLGNDLDPALVRAVQEALVDAVRAGSLPEQRLVEAGARVDALTDAPRTAGAPPVDADRQLAGARAALRVEGDLPDLAGALVVSTATAPGIAAGQVPWGLPARAVGAADAAALLREADDRPLVLQVRDAHRHGWVAALVAALPRGVVVEHGWPGPWPGPRPQVARVVTHGASLPARDAVAEVLAEKGWTP